MKVRRSTLLLITSSLILALLYGYYSYATSPKNRVQDISSYEDCVFAGYPVMESYPERCSVPGGDTYVRDITTDPAQTPVTLTGTYGVCLPKVNTGGPVTLECALGLQTTDGYYALDITNVSDPSDHVLQGEEQVTIKGTLVPKEMLSTSRWQTYDIIGVVDVESIDVN